MNILESNGTLQEVMREVFQRFSKNPALWVNGRVYTYSELGSLAQAIAHRVAVEAPVDKPVAIFSERNEIAYAAILGCVFAGRGYVALNPRFSAVRNQDILKQAGICFVICDARCAAMLRSETDPLLAHVKTFIPELPNSPWSLERSSQQRIPIQGSTNDLAYLLFTSGTTGRPKGVPVSQGNLLSYLANISQLVQPRCDDRMAQLADLTFDMSVHEMFLAWTAGAALYSIPDGRAPIVDRYIRDCELTLITIVPSAAGLMRSEGRLAAGSLPILRHSLFGGEALPVTLAAAWQKAAPGSTLRNLYGPTEATCCFTQFLWQNSLESTLTGSVPLGSPFDGQQIAVVDELLRPVESGKPGELLVCGSQVTRGYWNNPQATQNQYVRLSGKSGVWYRTGDLVKEDAQYGLCYCGRVDQQLKVRGFRVEVHDIESHVRKASGRDLVAVIGWPKNELGMVMGTVAFVASPKVNEAQIIEFCKKTMPDYMVPSRILPLPELPLNANGKVDYVALAKSKAL